MLPIAIPGCLVMLAVIICIRAGFRTIDGSVRAKSEGRCARGEEGAPHSSAVHR